MSKVIPFIVERYTELLTAVLIDAFCEPGCVFFVCNFDCAKHGSSHPRSWYHIALHLFLSLAGVSPETWLQLRYVHILLEVQRVVSRRSER